MRLPIATSLQEIPGFDHKKFQQELKNILQSILDIHATREAAVKHLEEANEHHLIPLVTKEFTGVVRFDCIWNAQSDAVKILEINCDYPDGLVLHDITYSVLNGSECTLHQDNLNKLFETDESVHVLYSQRAHFLDSYYAEERFLSKNRPSAIGNNIDEIKTGTTIRRCLEVTKLSTDDVHNLAKLGSRFVNTIALRTIGYKNLLESIKHRFVPKTVQVKSDTKDYCLTEKDNLVLKPSDGCEGYGIYFGNQLTTDEWLILINRVLNKNYVAQELVNLPKQTVSLFDEGGTVTKELYFDICPHFFIKDGQVIGSGHTLMRFSENRIVNVTQGGGIGYYKL